MVGSGVESGVEAGGQLINRSPLYEQQSALGAQFGLTEGWEMALPPARVLTL